jgi:predicted lipoprotein with Yx(FWY)xxD motif
MKTWHAMLTPETSTRVEYLLRYATLELDRSQLQIEGRAGVTDTNGVTARIPPDPARSMRYGRIVRWAGALTVLLFVGACGSSGSYQTPPSAVPPTIQASSLPQFQAGVLTDSAGFALYVFQPDHAQRATCTSTCAAAWPPVLLSPDQRPTAGPGVRPSLLGTDPYTPSRSVATYNGWPLYQYVNDTTAGVAAGQAANLNGGYWYAMGSDGVPIVPPGDPAAT